MDLGAVLRPEANATRTTRARGASGGSERSDDERSGERSLASARLVGDSGRLFVPRVGRARRRLDPPARTRECGDPAIDGYAHVVPECFDASATNREFDRSAAARERNVAWFEPHASYDGLAVAWGIGNVKQTARECAEACRAHVPPGKARGGPFGDLPCNAWVWCPIELERCFEPDAHTHRGGDCWLKFTETPEAPQLNQRGRNDDRRMAKDGVSYRKRHGDAPEEAHWWSGVMLPPGWTPSNGTYGPRATW